MPKFLFFLMLTSILFKADASTVQVTTDPICQKEMSVKCEGLTKKYTVSEIMKQHITFCLALRADLIKENARVSREYVDTHLYITIIDYLNNNELSHEDVVYFKDVQKILSSMPLQVGEIPSKQLKEKFLTLGGNGI